MNHMKKNQHIIITAVLVVVVGVAAFFAGTMYQKSQRATFALNGQAGQFQGRQGGGFRGGNAGFGGGANGFRPVVGEIISSDTNGITVKLEDGSSKIVIVSDKTTINKAATGTKDDLKTGEKVAAFGSQNSDGSITAQSIQLNPTMRVVTREKTVTK